jgi:hypothetical protein
MKGTPRGPESGGESTRGGQETWEPGNGDPVGGELAKE